MGRLKWLHVSPEPQVQYGGDERRGGACGLHRSTLVGSPPSSMTNHLWHSSVFKHKLSILFNFHSGTFAGSKREGFNLGKLAKGRVLWTAMYFLTENMQDPPNQGHVDRPSCTYSSALVKHLKNKILFVFTVAQHLGLQLGNISCRLRSLAITGLLSDSIFSDSLISDSSKANV